VWQWCESQKACGRLKLADLLVKPLQRLTKYKLLLYAVRAPLDKMTTSSGDVMTTDVIVSDRIAAVDTAVSRPTSLTDRRAFPSPIFAHATWFIRVVSLAVLFLYPLGWLGSRVDSGAEGLGFKSQPRRSLVTVLGKLFTPIAPLFTKQRNW